MNKQDCFDFLTDLALDNKDFDWAEQIQKQKTQANTESCIEDVLKEMISLGIIDIVAYWKKD